MAQGAPQLDYHVLQDLKQRFPEIPENVVSQCLLQNNNNLEVCCHLLAQESSRYLYEEFHSPEEVHLSRNRMLHISVGGFPPPESGNANANSNASYTNYFRSDHGRSASTPTPPPAVPGISPTYTPVPARYMTPITLALSSSIPSAPQALQIPPGAYVNSGNNLFMRPSPSQSPQPSPWASSGAPVYSPSPYSTPTYQSPYSSPQHQVFLPISPPTLPNMTYQHVPYRAYMPTKGSMKNQIEITLEGRQRSNSPIHTPQGALYMPNSPSPSSPSRAISMAPPPGTSFHPGVYLGGARPRPASSPQAGSSAYIKIKMGPGQQQQLGSGSPSPPVETESLLNIVDQGEKHGTPAPILPISATSGGRVSHVSHMPRRSSSGSDDYAYTQALLLHQRARMERLLKELRAEKQKLEQLKAEVNEMEYDALQRRFRRVNSSSFIPRPEEITRVRTQNRQLQIDIDCTLKETDLLQSRGKFDPKAMNNFYDNIQPGPVVPPKKDTAGVGGAAAVGGGAAPRPKPAPQRDEDFEGAQWNCESCTFLNHPALNRCEQCEMPRYT